LTPAVIEWEALRAAARVVALNARAPYSGLSVGAAALVDDGRMVVGCNVENASYGLSLCAELGVVSALVAGGPGRLVAVAVQARDAVLMPCGRCRQVLLEVAAPGCLVDGVDGPRLLASLLPDAFGPTDL
jgi:cytidine deaminase